MGNRWRLELDGGAWLPAGAARPAVGRAMARALGWMEHCAGLFGIEDRSLGLVLGGAAATRGTRVQAPLGLVLAAGRGDAGARLVLAHEMAHVAQAGLGGPGGRVAECEAEAGAAAAAALAGRRFACRVPAPAGHSLAWGPAGHYFTVYYMALSCGVSPDDALAMALYTQMPDMVVELDAHEAGNDIALKHHDLVDMWVTQPGLVQAMRYSATYEHFGQGVEVVGMDSDAFGNIHPVFMQGVDRALSDASYLAFGVWDHIDKKIWTDLEVQIGLHSLSGVSAASEQKFRRDTLVHKLDPLSVDFGLGLHAFGDSFAHVPIGGGTTYAAGLGHGGDGHSPDVISKHAQVYLDYCCQLYQVFLALPPGRLRRGKARDWTTVETELNQVIAKGAQAERDARRIASLGDYTLEFRGGKISNYTDLVFDFTTAEENAQQAFFEDKIKSLNGKPLGVPVSTTASWDAFVRRRPPGWPSTRAWLNPDELTYLLSLAFSWSRAPRDGSAVGFGVDTCRAVKMAGPGGVRR